MGPAHSTVVNQSTRKICIITFNNGDLLYKNYHSMFIFEPGQEGVVEANPDAVGLKIGVVYDANNKTKEFLYHRFLVKNESIFTISEVDSEEVSFFGNDIVSIGKGKVKETDNVPFQMGAAAVQNKQHKIDHSAAGVYIKNHSKDGWADKSKNSSDSPVTSKKEIKLGGLSVSVPTDMTSAMNMIKNKANEVKDKVKEKAKNVEEKIKEQVKNLDDKAKDLVKTKKEKENEERIEQERIRYEAEREAREEEERLAEEKFQQELREAEEEARILRESEEAMMLEMLRLEEEQAEKERAEEEAKKEALAKKTVGFFGRKKVTTPNTPTIADSPESNSKLSASKDSNQKSKVPSQVPTKVTSVPKKSTKPEVILSADPVLHPRPKKNNPNGNRKKTSYEGAVSSVMRKTTATHDDPNERDDMESIEVRNARMIKRRGAFRYLPAYFANDLLHGSYWFFWGSVLAMVIPILPILSILYHLYHHHGALEETLYLYIYGLLIFGGLMFSIGSYHFLRVFIEPPPEPYFNYCRCISNGANDELIAGWYFFLGTAPSVPVVSFYVVYLHYVSFTFIIALVICCLCTLAMLIFVLACIPDEDHYQHNIEEGPHQPKATSKFAPFFQKWCCEYTFHKHLLNDWLVAGWLMFWCCVFGTVCSGAMLMYEIYIFSWQGIYDWSTGLLDCIMFTIGSAYLIAGSYPVAPEKTAGPTKSRNHSYSSSYPSSYNDVGNKSSSYKSSSNKSASSSSNNKKSSEKTTKASKKKVEDDDADY